MIENYDINDVINIIDLEKINRFSRILDQNLKNDKVVEFYNEILDEIERLVSYIADLEEDNLQFHILLNKEKESRLQMQLFIGMLFYMSNTGKGDRVVGILASEICNYFIKDEIYYNTMIKLFNDVRTSK